MKSETATPPNADLTGNDYVSLPAIAADGAIDAVNVLHAASAGLIEWTGREALLRPRISVDGVAVPMNDLRWRRLDRWIPVFTATLPDGSTVTGTICAPGGYPPARGFLMRIEAENRGRKPHELRVELDVDWLWSRLWIETGRLLEGPNQMVVDRAGSLLSLETDGGRGPALAIAGSHDVHLRGGAGTDAVVDLEPGAVIRSPNGTPLRASISQVVSIKSNSRGGMVFYAGAGRERDGARAAAASLRRHGPDRWIRQARLELSHILRPAQDHRWAEPLNRNLIFNRYYAVGRALDDDRLYLMRSRSTRCPAPALFNEREALFWTLPALIIADPGIAREAMFRTFDIASERSGEYLRYIDGGACDAAFVLDQFLLYVWAIDHFVSTTDDTSALDDPLIRQIVLETDSAAYMRLHAQHLLAATELLPSGDLADHPYATVANVLLWVLCDRIPRLLTGPPGDDPPPRFMQAAAEVAAAIWQHCVTDVGGHPILACSSSLEGDAAVYDDPALSLALLPFFGFCGKDDPVWQATMDFLHSPSYPLWRTGTIPGMSARSGSPRPRTSALCSDLLADRTESALKRLLLLKLPAGVAAAEYDAETGDAFEPHHAALAGFLAWTLTHAAEPTDDMATRRKKRR